MKRISFSSHSSQQGSVLIEAMVAITLFAIGVLAVAGLQASMIKNTADSKYRAEASYIAQKTIGEMWANPSTIGLYAVDTAIPDLLPNGSISVKSPSIDTYTVIVTWQQPGQDVHTFTTIATITPMNPP